MTKLSKTRAVFFLFTALICCSVLVIQVFSISFEENVSRRQSVRSFSSENVSRQQLTDVLNFAYGYSNENRNTPKIGNAHSLVLFTLNQTGSYQYFPESNALVPHDLTTNKETIRAFNSDWPSNAKEVLVIVWNKTSMNNQYFAAAEAGCVAQNVHLATISQGLGTCVVGSINADGIRGALKLENTLTPLLVMPISHPESQYPVATPKYSIMAGNLPLVQYSESFEYALQNLVFTQEWNPEPLEPQELSQLLWASYGFTSTDHRTTPSAYGIYPLVVFFGNTTGVFKYLPETHSVTKILDTDKRFDVSNIFSGQTWAADAPALFIIGYDSAHTGDGGVFSHLFMEVNVGCVIQQLVLQASALNLQVNVLSEGLEEWNGAQTQQLRNTLELSSSIIPLYAMPVGGGKSSDRTSPSIYNINQQPAPDEVNPDQSVTVSVEVTDENSGLKQVTLSYSLDEGQTWENTEMEKTAGDTYTSQILGFEEGKQVTYKIVAYDHADNQAVEDNAGNYYIYTVIPEFQVIILMFIVLTTVAVYFSKKQFEQN